MTDLAATWDQAAIRSDGGLVRIRTVVPTDRDALRRLDAKASQKSIRNRFFTISRETADRYTDAVAASPNSSQRVALLALVDEHVVGLATLETIEPQVGELALLVADGVQHEGIGTLLLEQLIVAARRRELVRVVADVLTDNVAMHGVLARLGLGLRREIEGGVTHVEIDLGTTDGYAAAVTGRERVAERASLRHLRSPQSIAVVGAGTREHSVGRAVLENLIAADFAGQLFVVNPHHDEVLGIASVPSCADLPVAPDLVVIAVPSGQVPDVVKACGQRGAKVILLLTAGFGETGSAGSAGQVQLLATVRRYGMRLVGPNCLGVVNTDPAVRLNATFAPIPMQDGGLALVSQSGAVGIAIANAAARRGLGLAEFVSVGNKADVSSNDLLLAWDGDERISVIGLYLESFGNPRKFTRIARAVSRHTPVIALKAGRGKSGQRAGQSHTAAAAAAEPVVAALLAQAGVQRVDTMEQLLDAARVMHYQPRPAGDRVAIIGNSGGPGILAADAAEAAGLRVVELSEATQARVRAAAPSAASVQNPVDLGAAVPPDEVTTAITALLAADEVDSVVTVFTETLAASPEDIRAAVIAAARTAAAPIIATEVGAVPCSIPITGTERSLPVFGFPEAALEALAVAVRCARVASRVPTPTTMPEGIDLLRAREVVENLPVGGSPWLAPTETEALLHAFGVSMLDQRVVVGPDAAVEAASELGYPVAIKLVHSVHKTDVGGVRLDLRTEADVRAAVTAMAGITESDEVLVQPMRTTGVELILGGIQDPQFGPLVMLGAGGVLTDLIKARSLRLAPLTHDDAAAMLEVPELQRLLGGFRGAPAVSRTALVDLILRLSWLVDAVPEVAELDLNPVMCAGEDLVVVDAKIRIAAPRVLPDPLSRTLTNG